MESNNTTENRTYRRAPKGLIWGIAVIAVGVIFLFDQMGLVSADHLFRLFWPGLFLFLGIEALLYKTGSRKFWGTVLTAVGVVLLFNSFGVIHVTLAILWPLLIIFWGVSILLHTMGRGPLWKSDWPSNWFGQAGGGVGNSESWLDYTLIFSGVKRRITATNFKGGKVTAVFGGFTIDLRKADIEGDEAELHIDAVFGGGEVRVPETWHVSVRAAAIMGGYVDETRAPIDLGPNTKRLIVTGAAVFGGVNVKN